MDKRQNTVARQPARPDTPGRGVQPILRHRQARLRLQPRPLTGPERFAHLKRVYD